MDTPHLPYPLDLGDGREPIMCRDAHQASLLLGLWRAWNRCANGQIRAAAQVNALRPELTRVQPWKEQV